MRPRHAISALLAAGALAAAGCGGGGGSTQSASPVTATAGSLHPVVDAASKTAAQGSAQVGVHGFTELAGRRMQIDGAGAFDLRAGKGRFAATAQIAGRRARVDAVADGKALYLRAGALAGRLPGGKHWLKLDVGKAGLSSLGGVDPGELLAALRRAADVHEVGHATIDGTPTTHYAGTIDLARGGTTAGARALRALAQRAGVERVPVEAWVGDDGLVRRARVAATAAGGAAGSARVDLTVDFTNFGRSVDAPAPPPDDVLDASRLAGLLGG
jgi:hypothetical protein